MPVSGMMPTPHKGEFIELFEERDGVSDEYTAFCREDVIWTDNMI